MPLLNPPTATNRRFLAQSRPRRQVGAGLIEVLVAVLVVSIGLLGIALVQIRSLSGNNSSMSQTMAVVASYSILEALRLDRGAAVAGSYNTPTGGLKGNACPTTTATLAQSQLGAWCTELAARLGNVATTVATINCNSTTAICTVRIQFDDSRGLGKGDTTAILTQAVTTQSMI